MRVSTFADLKVCLKVLDYQDGQEKFAGRLILKLERPPQMNFIWRAVCRWTARLRVIQVEKMVTEEYDPIADIAHFEKQDIMGIIKSQPKADNLKRGDVITFERSYRNSEVLGMYDGEHIVDLFYDLDDYGSVPKEFVVFQPFVPDYWQGIIVHNDYVWLDLKSSRDEILTSVKFTPPVSHAYFTQANNKCLLEIVNNPALIAQDAWLDALQRKLRDPQPIWAVLAKTGEFCLYCLVNEAQLQHIPHASQPYDYRLQIELGWSSSLI